MVVKTNVTGAGYGIMSWLYQRVTAIIMLVFALLTIGVIIFIGLNSNGSISSWQNIFACTWVKILTQLFFSALLIHAWIGIRDIWMDYAKCRYLRVTLHTLTILWLLASLIYSIKVIW
jgi:succinate dehydrogenase / fumarate reductase membrane anchor subunit